MGRSGQLVRPCWLDAGSVAGGEQLVARLVVRLVQASFFGQMCAQLCIVFSDIFEISGFSISLWEALGKL